MATLNQIASAAHGSRRRFEQGEIGGILVGVGQPRERAAELIGVADLLPHRPDDVDHLPVGDPLAARAFALFALGAGDRALHARGDAGFGDPTGMFGSMPPCHSANWPLRSGVLTARRTRSS